MNYLATLTHTGLAMRVPYLPAQPLRAGASQTLTMVRDGLIPIPVLIEAHRQVDALAADLGIPVPYVVWFGPKAEIPRDVRSCGCGDWIRTADADCSVLGGLAVPDPPDPDMPQLIFILWSLRGELLEMVIRHEMRHLAQSDDLTIEEREVDAERYGMAHVA